MDVSELAQLAESAPEAALSQADLALDAAAEDVARVRAYWGRGRAHFELGQSEDAVTDLEKAVDLAEPALRPEIQVTLAASLNSAGRTSDAIEILTAVAEATPSDRTRALAESQIGMILIHEGDLPRALVLLDQSSQFFRSTSDARALSRVVTNLGVAQLLSNDFAGAANAFRESLALSETTDQDLQTAGALLNLGYCEMKLGRTPSAISYMERAKGVFERVDSPARGLAVFYDDLAETYRQAGLVAQAVEAAEQSLRIARESGNLAQAADSDYRLAVCLLDGGNDNQASMHAEKAGQAFASAGRETQALRARTIAYEAAPGSDPSAMKAGRQAAEELEGKGWTVESIRLLNRLDLKMLDQRPSSVSSRPKRIPPGQSIEAQLEVLLADSIRLADSDPVPALNEAAALIAAHRAQLSDAELRAGTERLQRHFRHIHVRHELRQGDAEALFTAVDTWRTSAATARPFVGRDAKLDSLLHEIRSLRSEAQAAPLNGEQNARLASLESSVKRRSMQLTAETSISDAEYSKASLPGRTVQLFAHGDEFHAVVRSSGEYRHENLGPLAPLARAASRLKETSRQLLAADQSSRLAGVLLEALRSDATQLRSQLQVEEDESLTVICPPHEMFDLSWSWILPSSPIVVARSETDYLQPQATAAATSFWAVLGPGLEFAHSDLGAGSPATAYRDEQATAPTLRRAVVESDAVHVAAHGTYRPDSPRFSALELADGPFSLYELDSVDRAPQLVFLASCDAGRLTTEPTGDVALGVVPAWLNAGSDTVMAPMAEVPDRETGLFAQVFYEHLRSSTPEAAHAQARTAFEESGSPVEIAVAHAFQRYGRHASEFPDRFVSAAAAPSL